MPSWLRPQANWQTNDTLQMLKLGIDQQQQEQQMALALREMALREQSQSILSEMRLSKMDEDQAEAADMPALQAYANNPGMGVPAFKSPKSYQKLQAIDLQRSRSELGKQQAADMADFNRRLAKVDARDRFAISEAMRKGAPAAEVWDALAAAEQKSDVTMEPIYGPNGQFLGMAVTGKGTKLITNTARMSDVDKLEYSAAQKEIQAINKQMRDPLTARMVERDPKQKATLQQSLAEAQRKIGEILSRYEAPDDGTGARTGAAVPPANQNDPLGLR